MADPTIQTFCCHHGNGSDVAIMVMKELNTDGYNTACILSSALGVLGAIYQILPREQYVHHHKWVSLTAQRGRQIIIWLAVSDLLASLGVLVRSSQWLHYKNIMPRFDDVTGVLFCAICSAVAQYFYMATWIWTLCYSIDMRLLLNEKETHIKYYHLAAWTIPAILTSTGLSMLYYPNGECHIESTFNSVLLKILPNYLATYGPITLVMVANPILYFSSIKTLEKVIITISGQYTVKEREVLHAIKRKFLFINLVFFVCWSPNLLNGILIWILWFRLPTKVIISLWYIMAALNPLQALFNCFVYRRWNKGSERIVRPRKVWNKIRFGSQLNGRSPHSTSHASSEETLPLLANLPRPSINSYTDNR